MGAGASRGHRGRDADGKEDPSNIAEGLPIVKEIPKRLNIIASKYADLKYDEGNIFEKQTVSVDLVNAKKNLVDGLHWLRANSEKATIDTFAKQLFLTGQFDDYIKLKRLLSIFLLTEQLVNRPDSRYVNFLTSVLQRNDGGKLRITDDITILTWNYDSQFEIAYKYFLSIGQNPEKIDFPEQLGIDIHNSYNSHKKVFDFPDLSVVVALPRAERGGLVYTVRIAREPHIGARTQEGLEFVEEGGLAALLHHAFVIGIVWIVRELPHQPDRIAPAPVAQGIKGRLPRLRDVVDDLRAAPGNDAQLDPPLAFGRDGDIALSSVRGVDRKALVRRGGLQIAVDRHIAQSRRGFFPPRSKLRDRAGRRGVEIQRAEHA